MDERLADVADESSNERAVVGDDFASADHEMDLTGTGIGNVDHDGFVR